MNYKRVNKPTARRIFNSGHPVRLLPCKIADVWATDDAPRGHFWVGYVEISKDTTEELPASSTDKFDRIVDHYTYYNCNTELGMYPHYFVREDDYNEYKEEMSYGGTY